MMHFDGAKEYIALQNDIGGKGGLNQNKSFSPPYSTELNGIAERVNRTMVEAALSMLIQANLPSSNLVHWKRYIWKPLTMVYTKSLSLLI